MRPLTPAVPGVSFPVYADLAKKMLEPESPFSLNADHPDRVVARTLAVASGYAYSDADTVAAMMARMGLEGNRCRMIGMSVDAMFIVATAFVVQSNDGRVVILAYRGTQPIGIIGWLADSELSRSKVALLFGDQGAYEVHSGFYRNVRAVRYKVTEALKRAANGIPVTAVPGEDEPSLQKMEALYITGHSLGGAMASLETILTKEVPLHDQAYGDQLRATYTFGQPMVGTPELARVCNEHPFLGHRVIRFLHQADPIPHMPPRDTGEFAHFGRMFKFEGVGWKERTGEGADGQLGTVGSFIASGLASIRNNFPALQSFGGGYRLSDHYPQCYIEALTGAGELTEFGDNKYGGGVAVLPRT